MINDINLIILLNVIPDNSKGAVLFGLLLSVKIFVTPGLLGYKCQS